VTDHPWNRVINLVNTILDDKDYQHRIYVEYAKSSVPEDADHAVGVAEGRHRLALEIAQILDIRK
jgi:hypothetical protein